MVSKLRSELSPTPLALPKNGSVRRLCRTQILGVDRSVRIHDLGKPAPHLGSRRSVSFQRSTPEKFCRKS